MSSVGVCVIDLSIKGWIQIAKIFSAPVGLRFSVYIYDTPNTAQSTDREGKTEYSVLCQCPGYPHSTCIRDVGVSHHTMDRISKAKKP